MIEVKVLVDGMISNTMLTEFIEVCEFLKMSDGEKIENMREVSWICSLYFDELSDRVKEVYVLYETMKEL
jgi:hypothetical protein